MKKGFYIDLASTIVLQYNDGDKGMIRVHD